MEHADISRRRFLEGAASVGAIAALGGLASCTPAKSSGSSGSASSSAAGSNSWASKLNVDLASVLPGNTSESVKVSQTKDCDVVVVGAGCSGTNTAVRAAEKGLKVILVEKTTTVGGCCNKSSGPTAPNSKYEKAAGSSTDVSSVVTTWVADSHWRVNASAVRQLVATAGEAVDWMSDSYGWEFVYTKMFTKLPDYAKREPLFRAMLEKTVLKNGGELMENATAKSLVTGSNGEVTGVVVKDGDGNGVQINAKAVVLATGGYGGNTNMVKTAFHFTGPLMGLPQNIGEGLEMAWKVGAQKPLNFGGQMLHQTLARASDKLVSEFDAFPAKYPMILCYVAQMLNVEASGARFRSESLALSPVPAANSSVYQGTFHYVVVSKSIMDTLEQKGLAGIGVTASPGLPPAYKPAFELDTPWKDVSKVFDKMVEEGNGYKGDTVEALAEAAGMDKAIFTAQFKKYESYCAAGVDEQFGKEAKYLLPLGSGPYYIIIAEENNLGSWGGLLTNVDYQVLDDNRLPVKGLYAVGNEAGSNLYNDTYVGSGYAMANTITSGYICGARLAATLKG